MAIRVLIVSDEPERLEQTSAALAELCPDWELLKADGASQALAILAEQPCQALACLMRQPLADGAPLLNEAARLAPSMLRLIAGEPSERESIAQAVSGSHHFVPARIDAEGVRQELSRAMTLDRWLGSEEMRRLVSEIRTFPSIPARYFEVLKELRSENPSCARVGEIISQDMAMCTKILQTLNSPIFGLSRQITDPAEAVAMLGFEMVKSLVLCIQVFSQFTPQKLSVELIDRTWRHSTRVAHAARKIALAEKAGRQTADDAFTAGLLHDLGKLALAAEFPEKYQQAVDRARAAAVSVSAIEREVFGAAHGEVGAYLLVNWGLPISLGEAVAYHHYPSRCDSAEFGLVCAVHAANALVHEKEPEQDGLIHDPVDERYLAQIGMLGRSQVWREALAGPVPVKLEAAALLRESSAAQDSMTYLPARPLAASASRPASSEGPGLFGRLAFWRKR